MAPSAIRRAVPRTPSAPPSSAARPCAPVPPGAVAALQLAHGFPPEVAPALAHRVLDLCEESAAEYGRHRARRDRESLARFVVGAITVLATLGAVVYLVEARHWAAWQVAGVLSLTIMLAGFVTQTPIVSERLMLQLLARGRRGLQQTAPHPLFADILAWAAAHQDQEWTGETEEGGQEDSSGS